MIKQYIDTRTFYAEQSTDNPGSLMGFRGTFTFSEHGLVPDLIREYVLLVTRKERFSQIPLEEINRLAREIHGGETGVPLRIIDAMTEIRAKRALEQQDEPNERSTYTPEHTLDDWTNQGAIVHKEAEL
jgi:hypothetical protein